MRTTETSGAGANSAYQVSPINRDHLPEIINHDTLQRAVSARELYLDLGLNESHYKRWCRKNIINNTFATQNEDWVPLALMAKTPNGGRSTQDYALSIDFAKRLAMMARTEKGEMVRRYFMDCERVIQTNDLSISNKLEKILLAQTEQIQAMTQMVQSVLNVALSGNFSKETVARQEVTSGNGDNLIAATVIAAELGMTARELNLRLNALGIIYKVAGAWVLYAKYKDLELTGTRTVKWQDSQGQERTVLHTYWTQRGRTFIHQVLQKQRQNNSLNINH